MVQAGSGEHCALGCPAWCGSVVTLSILLSVPAQYFLVCYSSNASDSSFFFFFSLSPGLAKLPAFDFSDLSAKINLF